MNVQVLTEPAGELLRISPALPGRTHDLTAARTHRIIRICERQGIPVLADRAYQGVGPWVTTGLKRPPGVELTLTQRTVNRALARARAPVERGMARLKSWQIFRRSRISPNRMTVITKAVLTLERQRRKRSVQGEAFPSTGSPSLWQASRGQDERDGDGAVATTRTFVVGPDDDPDKYRLIRQVGGGGEAELWEADMAFAGGRERVAVKVLRADHAADMPSWRDRWAEQVELLRLIRHPGVVGVHQDFEGAQMHPAGEPPSHGRALYLVMNWFEGHDLREWVVQHRSIADRFQALRYLAQIAEVLDWLHSGRATPSGRPVVHGDISPANVIVNTDGQAILVDFGLFRMARHVTRVAAGTQGYCAPEVVREGTYSPASDRYAFGALAFYVLTGTHPPADSAALRANLVSMATFGEQPPPVEQLAAIFADDPTQRPSATQWMQALRLQSSTASVRSGPLPPPVPVMKPGYGTVGVQRQDLAGQPRAPHLAGRPRAPRVAPAVLAGVVALLAVVGVIAGLAYIGDGDGRPSDGNAAQPRHTPSVPAGKEEGKVGGDASPPADDGPGGQQVPLTSLDDVARSVEHASMETGQQTIKGKRYSATLYAYGHPCGTGMAEFNLVGGYREFRGLVGLADESETGSSATFTVYVDDKQVASAKVGLFQTKTLTASVSGGNRLRLVMDSDDCEVTPVFADAYLVSAK